jgi:hypothetical protein
MPVTIPDQSAPVAFRMLTVADVRQLVCKLLTHEFENLEQLLKVESLLTGNNVDVFVELVIPETLVRASNITGKVDTCTI